ncbi:MAG: hypothetical protein HN758_01685, partial [Verrucomicrobia bacterium]|nr:hypothetical protein [Verrucomicrobiota bacterium]
MRKNLNNKRMTIQSKWVWLAYLLPMCSTAIGADWVSMFNGEDFTGWVQRG